MSKQIKQMEMDTLNKAFKGVRDLVTMSVTGLASQTDNQIRLNLRKKNIFLHVVKNSLAKRVFEGMGMTLTKAWEGPTTVAFGGNSIAELCKELEAIFKKNEKSFKVKTAVVDGQEVPFATALKMPTKPEAIGRVLSLALSPASRLISQIIGPASSLASQIKTISEKKEEPAPAPAA